MWPPSAIYPHGEHGWLQDELRHTPGYWDWTCQQSSHDWHTPGYSQRSQYWHNLRYWSNHSSQNRHSPGYWSNQTSGYWSSQSSQNWTNQNSHNLSSHSSQNWHTSGYWSNHNQQSQRRSQNRFSPYQGRQVDMARYRPYQGSQVDMARYRPYQGRQMDMARYRPSLPGPGVQYHDRSSVGMGEGRRRYRTGLRDREWVEIVSSGIRQVGQMNTKEKEGTDEFKDKEIGKEVPEDAVDRNVTENDLNHFYQRRLWTKTVGPETVPALMRFRVMCYNILAQEYIGAFPELYTMCDKSALDWGVRFKGIKREVVMFEPDIVCMQEVQFFLEADNSNHFQSDLEPFFSSQGYGHQFKQKTSLKVDGCVIFYKADKFKLAAVKTVEFKSETIPALDSDTVGIICKLIPLAVPTTPLVVATSHLLYTVSREHTRVCQAALLLAELDQFAQAPGGGYHPTILTGDFNSCASHPSLKLLLEGQLQYDGDTGLRTVPGQQLYQELGLLDNCQFRPSGVAGQVTGSFHHKFGFLSVYPPAPGVSTFQQGWKLVDHIMYSTTTHLRLLSMLSLPTSSHMRHLPRIPSHISPSDHLPLLADFSVLNS